MDERVMTGDGYSRGAKGIPWPVWLLLAGAILQLGVQIAPDSYRIFGPYMLVTGDMVISWIRAMSPFLLAAVVVLAVDRWPPGSRRLLIAAAALAVVGLLRIASDAWWAIWEAAPGDLSDGIQLLLTGAFLGTGVAFFLAHALMAGGLWAARTDGSPGRIRIALMTLIALAGLIATGAGFWKVVPTIESAGSDEYLWVALAGTLTIAAGFASLAVVAIAATRCAPRGDGGPEVVIAIGATVTMVASAWTWCAPYVAPDVAGTEAGFLWVYSIPNAAAALGALAMVAGFGLGALGLRRRRVTDAPIA